MPPDRICDGEEGVAYYNDSKGTNPDAAIKAVEAMNRPTILIGEDMIRTLLMMSGLILSGKK